MIDSTSLSIVVDQSPAGTTQLAVETDTGSEAHEAMRNLFSEVFQSTSSVRLQSEFVFADPRQPSSSGPPESQRQVPLGIRLRKRRRDQAGGPDWIRRAILVTSVFIPPAKVAVTDGSESLPTGIRQIRQKDMDVLTSERRQRGERPVVGKRSVCVRGDGTTRG